jgi:hypothetical protein
LRSSCFRSRQRRSGGVGGRSLSDPRCRNGLRSKAAVVIVIVAVVALSR